MRIPKWVFMVAALGFLAFSLTIAGSQFLREHQSDKHSNKAKAAADQIGRELHSIRELLRSEAVQQLAEQVVTGAENDSNWAETELRTRVGQRLESQPTIRFLPANAALETRLDYQLLEQILVAQQSGQSDFTVLLDHENHTNESIISMVQSIHYDQSGSSVQSKLPAGYMAVRIPWLRLEKPDLPTPLIWAQGNFKIDPETSQLEDNWRRIAIADTTFSIAWPAPTARPYQVSLWLLIAGLGLLLVIQLARRFRTSSV